MTLNIKATYSDTDVVIVAFLRMSTSNFQWRHDGLGWRIKHVATESSYELVQF